jgi:hypothetical protein
LTFTGCSSTTSGNSTEDVFASADIQETASDDSEFAMYSLPKELAVPADYEFNADGLAELENSVYTYLVDELGDDYFVENVQASHMSSEYVQELAYNSKENVYFGYNLKSLEEQYQGKKFVFTVGEDGTTITKEFEEYDDTYDKVIRNVAVGTGVILICVTVTNVAAAAGAAAVSMIFSVAANTAGISAITGGAFSGVVTGVVTGVSTNDFDTTLKATALAASDGFMWGAITGAVAGGAGEAIALRGATLNGLTMNQAAQLQKSTKWPLSTIKSLQSADEAAIYSNAGLTATKINGQDAMVRTINWNYIDKDGFTNVQRVAKGLSPLDDTGVAYELHHIGQKIDSPLAILTKSEHMQGGNNKILHTLTGDGVHNEATGISNSEWSKQVKAFWEAYLQKAIEQGVV